MVEIKSLIKEVAGKYSHSKESIMPVLQAIINEKNYLSESDITAVAEELDLSAAEVYGTASFYTFLDLQKRGKYLIRVCKSIIAVMKGKDEVLKTIENILGIKPGETTPDGMFTLLETNDIGWSDKEPSMMINDKVYTDLTPEKTGEIIMSYLDK